MAPKVLQWNRFIDILSARIYILLNVEHGENLLIPQAIEQVEQGHSLDEGQMASVFDIIMKGEATDRETSSLLTALYEKGESVEELAGAAKAMRWHMDTVQTNRSNVVDTCGTGGGGTHTFNVSTLPISAST